MGVQGLSTKVSFMEIEVRGEPKKDFYTVSFTNAIGQEAFPPKKFCGSDKMRFDVMEHFKVEVANRGELTSVLRLRLQLSFPKRGSAFFGAIEIQALNRKLHGHEFC